MDTYNRDLPPGAPCWEPSVNITQCPYCGISFNFWNRKHHCRACGRVICGGCSKNRMDLPQFGFSKAERVCDVCHKGLTDSMPSILYWMNDPMAQRNTNSTGGLILTEKLNSSLIDDGTAELLEEATRTQFTSSDAPNQRVIAYWHSLVEDPSRSYELKGRVLVGVPNYVRGFVWKHLSEAIPSMQKNGKSGESDLYPSLLKIHNKTIEEMVGNDIHRTFPAHPLFADGAAGQKMLFNILKAYGNLNHYSQCMSYIAAVLIMHMCEEDAFFVFVQMMKKYGLEAIFQHDLPACLRNYNQFVQATRPALYQHLIEQRLSVEIFIASWLQTLFAQQFDLGLVFRLWDVFFVYGFAFLVKVTLVLLKHAEPTLLKLSSSEIIFSLKSLPSRVQDFDRLIDEAISLEIPEDLLTQYMEEEDKIPTMQHSPIVTIQSPSGRSSKGHSRQPSLSKTPISFFKESFSSPSTISKTPPQTLSKSVQSSNNSSDMEEREPNSGRTPKNTQGPSTPIISVIQSAVIDIRTTISSSPSLPVARNSPEWPKTFSVS